MSKDILDVMRKRRTIRKFTEKDVSEEQVETLLEMAMCAPTRLNRQPWHFVVIRDKELQKQLADLLRVHPYLETAPAVIAVCGLPAASPTWIMDVSAATENMLLAATAMGLGAAWVGAPNTTLWDLCEEALCDARLSHKTSVGKIAAVVYTEWDNQCQLEVAVVPPIVVTTSKRSRESRIFHQGSAQFD